jgi:hypothetical protein
MGCQCTKANEKSNMDLEHAPPKLLVQTVELQREEKQEKPEKEEHLAIEEVQVKFKFLKIFPYYISSFRAK